MIIGIGFLQNRSKIEEQLCNLCDQQNYVIEFGDNACPQDLRNGVKIVLERFSIQLIGFLRNPKNLSENEAISIGTALDYGKNTEIFFDFLRQVRNIVFNEKIAEFVVLFATGWSTTQRVRKREGTIDDLLFLLSQPCSWEEEYYEPHTDSYWCSDDYPLVFTVLVNKHVVQ